MAEKEYSALIAEAKAALDSYSAEQEAIARLYEQAKQNAQAAYEAQKQQLAQKTAADRNQAAVDMLRTEKNLNQTLASRGLAFSGENAQNRLDLSLALQGQLADIDSAGREQEAELDRENAERQNGLELEYAKYRADGAERKASLQSELAGVQAAAAASQSASEGSGTEGTEKTGTFKLPFEVNGSIFNAVNQKLQEALSQKNGAEETDPPEGGMTPSVSARDLAKQMVSSVGGSGSISGYTQQTQMKKLLEALQEEYRLEDAYYRELLLNLQSMGYRSDYAEQTDAGIGELQKKASELLSTLYNRYYNLYRNSGYGVEESDRLAGEAAQFGQLAYLYANSESKELFERAVIAMGLSGSLEDFYDRIAEKNRERAGSYTLGSALEK